MCSCKSELSSCQVGPHTERTYHRPSGHTSCEATNQIKKKGTSDGALDREREGVRERGGDGPRRADAHAGIIDARRAHKRVPAAICVCPLALCVSEINGC